MATKFLEFVPVNLTEAEVFQCVAEEIQINDDDQEDNKSEFVEKTSTKLEISNIFKLFKWDVQREHHLHSYQEQDKYEQFINDILY